MAFYPTPSVQNSSKPFNLYTKMCCCKRKFNYLQNNSSLRYPRLIHNSLWLRCFHHWEYNSEVLRIMSMHFYRVADSVTVNCIFKAWMPSCNQTGPLNRPIITFSWAEPFSFSLGREKSRFYLNQSYYYNKNVNNWVIPAHHAEIHEGKKYKLISHACLNRRSYPSFVFYPPLVYKLVFNAHTFNL